MLLFFYGGGWTDGTRADYEFVASSFAREGYLVVLPDYRLHPEVTFPAFVEDAAAAATWVQEHAADHGGTRRRSSSPGTPPAPTSPPTSRCGRTRCWKRAATRRASRG